MTDPKPPARVYADEEIGRILKRATELQHREPKAPQVGVTLAELEEIAREAGIDPTYLRRAAMEVDAGTADPTFWSKVAGEEFDVVREVTLPGELDQDGFERIVAAIQASSREHGQPSLLGRTLTWRAETPSNTRKIQLVVTSRDGQTMIRVEENLSQLAGGIFGGITAGAGFGIGLGVGLPIGIEVLGSALFATVAPLGITGLAFLASRAIYRHSVKRRRDAVGRLFDAVVAESQAAIDANTVASGTADEQPRLGAGRTEAGA